MKTNSMTEIVSKLIKGHYK